MPVKHLFFDLDHTLWDFDKNSRETLFHIFNELNLDAFASICFKDFYATYIRINDSLWEKYRNNEVTKEQLRTKRFYETMLFFGVDNLVLTNRINTLYVDRCPLMGYLFDSCHYVLERLSKQYTLHIISNGFYETQKRKIQSCKLGMYFDVIITSDKAGVHKPNSKIFSLALSQANAKAKESVMIGDNYELDCLGAESVGLSSVWFNPNKRSLNKEIEKEISDLKDLLKLF